MTAVFGLDDYEQPVNTDSDSLLLSEELEERTGQKYTRADMAEAIVHVEGISRSQSTRIVKLIFSNMALALVSGKKVCIPEIGRIFGLYYGSRKGVHPLTLEEITVAPSVRLKIVPCSSLKKVLNNELKTFESKKFETESVIHEQEI